jgi:hypothetical protein
LWQRSRSATAPVHVATGAVCIVRPTSASLCPGPMVGQKSYLMIRFLSS